MTLINAWRYRIWTRYDRWRMDRIANRVWRQHRRRRDASAWHNSEWQRGDVARRNRMHDRLHQCGWRP